MKGWILRLAALPVLLMSSTPAAAHAFPEHAEPRVGAVLRESPQQVKLWFSEKLEPAFSTLQVFAADGTRVDRGDGKVSAEDRHLLHVDLPALPAGTYTVAWNVLAVDGHHTAGQFRFTVQ